MSSFGLYVLGFAVLLGGLGYGASAPRPRNLIIVGALHHRRHRHHARRDADQDARPFQ